MAEFTVQLDSNANWNDDEVISYSSLVQWTWALRLSAKSAIELQFLFNCLLCFGHFQVNPILFIVHFFIAMQNITINEML